MKKLITIFIFLLILTALAQSQTPQYYNYNTTNAGNTFPFGTVGGRMVQWLILPGEINQPVSARSGNITKIYCMVATSFGPITYTQLSILFGQAVLTTLPQGVFYTGPRDTVYKRVSVSITGTLLNWLVFTLDHPFAYDSTKSLIIQIEQLGASSASLYNLGTTYLTGRRRTYSTPLPFSVQGQDAYVYNFGVDITPVTGIEPTINTQIPDKFKLYQNYPNPFNPMTKIRFEIAQHTPYPLSRGENISLKVFDILGKEVATLVNETLQPGSHEVTFDGNNLPSGIYFYQLRAGEFVETKKLILLK